MITLYENCVISCVCPYEEEVLAEIRSDQNRFSDPVDGITLEADGPFASRCTSCEKLSTLQLRLSGNFVNIYMDEEVM